MVTLNSINFMKNLIIILLCFITYLGQSQEKAFQTFKDTRVVNGHSVETLRGGRMDIRIAHRFGDIAGDAGGWQTFYGLENAADVLLGVEFGLTDKFMIGFNRAKGAGPLRQNVASFMKIRLIEQEIGGNQPFSLAVLGMNTVSTMPKSPTEGVLSFFSSNAHRLSYHIELIAAKKFSDYFSLQLTGAWTYRNLVPSNDKNDLVSMGLATRIQLTKSIGILLDAKMPFAELQTTENGYYPSLGFGFEWETGGGHVFQWNVTNSKGLVETDFIPYTTSNWADGEFRLGFTISRLFTL